MSKTKETVYKFTTTRPDGTKLITTVKEADLTAEQKDFFYQDLCEKVDQYPEAVIERFLKFAHSLVEKTRKSEPKIVSPDGGPMPFIKGEA